LKKLLFLLNVFYYCNWFGCDITQHFMVVRIEIT